jgi:hypothetical protein
MKQNQVIAITNGKKSQTEKTITKIYQSLEKTDLFSGVDRIYRPIDDEGIKRPAEKKLVQETVDKSLDLFKTSMIDMINFVATMDIGNCSAKANIVVDGKIVAEAVPATHLIFLDKKLTDIHTFMTKLPTLDASEKWSWNSNIGCYSAEPRETTSTGKVFQHKVLYEATKEHPAQIEKFTIDQIVGYWTTVAMSGNIAVDDKKRLIENTRKLHDAVKIALEEANSIEVTVSNIGEKVFNFIFSK